MAQSLPDALPDLDRNPDPQPVTNTAAPEQVASVPTSSSSEAARPSEVVVRPVRALPLAESTPATRESEAEPTVDRAPELAPTRLRSGAKDVAWVMRQPPDRYTLQLFGTSNRERLVTYVNRQEDIAEFALLTLERDGQPWYVVTYGVFSSPSAARTASEELPDTVGRVDPWVRRFSAVQAHVNETSP
jgi:DamX protein